MNVLVIEKGRSKELSVDKKTSGYVNIGIYFTKHQRKEDKQYVHMVMYEADGYGKAGRNIILEERIEMKPWIYT